MADDGAANLLTSSSQAKHSDLSEIFSKIASDYSLLGETDKSVSQNAQYVLNGIERGRFDEDQLTALKNVAKLFDDTNLRHWGASLLGIVEHVFFLHGFSSLVGMLDGFRRYGNDWDMSPRDWRGFLYANFGKMEKAVFDVVVDRDHIDKSAWAWLIDVVINRGYDDTNAEMSLSTLLNEGETGLVQKFLEVWDLLRWTTLENNLYALMHVAATQEQMSDARRSLFARVLEILKVGTTRSLGKATLQILDYVTALLSFPELDSEIEQMMIRLFDKLTDPESYILEKDTLSTASKKKMDEPGINILVSSFLANLLYLNYSLFRRSRSHEKRRGLLLNSKVVALLKVAVTQKLNSSRLILMTYALEEGLKEESGQNSMFDFFAAPLLDAKEQKRLDETKLGWDDYVWYLKIYHTKKSPDDGNGSSGTPPSRQTPSSVQNLHRGGGTSMLPVSKFALPLSLNIGARPCLTQIPFLPGGATAVGLIPVTPFVLPVP